MANWAFLSCSGGWHVGARGKPGTQSDALVFAEQAEGWSLIELGRSGRSRFIPAAGGIKNSTWDVCSVS